MAAPIKRTTHRLTGSDLRRFLARVFAVETDLSGSEADALAERTSSLIVSARIHTSAAGALRARSRKPPRRPSKAPVPAEAQAQAETTTSVSPAQDEPPKQAATDDPTEFDPYALGLVPTFQRSGPDGLAQKLDDIPGVDNLRKMARAQQIALPADIRRGDVPAETIRAAIVRAVEKRIADRRAAAG